MPNIRAPALPLPGLPTKKKEALHSRHIPNGSCLPSLEDALGKEKAYPNLSQMHPAGMEPGHTHAYCFFGGKREKSDRDFIQGLDSPVPFQEPVSMASFWSSRFGR